MERAKQERSAGKLETKKATRPPTKTDRVALQKNIDPIIGVFFLRGPKKTQKQEDFYRFLEGTTMKNTTSFYRVMTAARGYGQTSSSIACEAATKDKPITSAAMWDYCQQKQRKRLLNLAQRQAAASLEEIDVKALNRSFPLDALPRPIREMTRTIGDYYNTPYAAIAAIGLSVASSVLGCFKTAYTFNGVDITPLFHTFNVAPQSTGKTKTRKEFTEPLDKLQAELDGVSKDPKNSISYLTCRQKGLERKIVSGKSLSADEMKEYGEIQDKILVKKWKERIEMPAKSSVQALWYQSALNEIAAKLRGEKPHGILFSMSDARTQVRTDTQKADDAAGDFWEKFLDVLNFCEQPTPAIGDKERPIQRAGAAWILDVQPHHCSFVCKGATGAGGFPRRFVWVNMPSQDDATTTKPELNLDPLQNDLETLYRDLIHWGGADRLSCGYREAWEAWASPKAEEYNRIRHTDPVKAAYTKTVYSEYVHNLALLLHVCNNVSSGVSETIDADTFNDAARLFDAFLASRDSTWAIMQDATQTTKNEQDDDLPKGFDALTAAAQKVYRVAYEIKTTQGRNATISDIQGPVNAYRNKENRRKIDDELLRAGFMFVAPESARYGDILGSGERVFVPIFDLDENAEQLIDVTADAIRPDTGAIRV